MNEGEVGGWVGIGMWGIDGSVIVSRYVCWHNVVIE
jgi:hypothetical protein